MVRKKRAGLATEAEPVHYSTAGFLKAQQQARDVSPIPTKTESSCEECANGLDCSALQDHCGVDGTRTVPGRNRGHYSLSNRSLRLLLLLLG